MRNQNTGESLVSNQEAIAGVGAAIEKPVAELETVSLKKLNWHKDTEPFFRSAIRQLVPRDAYIKITHSSLAELKSHYINSLDSLFELIDSDTSQRGFDTYITEMVAAEDPIFRQLLAKQLETPRREETYDKLASSLLKNMLESITCEEFERNEEKYFSTDLRQKFLSEDMQRALIEQLENYDETEYPNSTMRALLSQSLPQVAYFLADASKIETKVRPQLLMRAENAETRLKALKTYGRYDGEVIATAVLERLVHDQDATVRFEAQMILVERYLDSLREPEDDRIIATKESIKFFDWIKSLPASEATSICESLTQRKRKTRMFLVDNLHRLSKRKEFTATAILLLNDEHETVHSAIMEILPEFPSGRLKTTLIESIVSGSDKALKIDLLSTIHTLESWMAREVFVNLAKDEDRDVKEAVELYLYRLSQCDQREVQEILGIIPIAS